MRLVTIAGFFLVIASGIWTVFWIAAAFTAWAFHGDTVAWVMTVGSLLGGLVVFAFGLRLAAR